MKPVENRYYVYRHIDPVTFEIVYIGAGCGLRAFNRRKWKKRGKEHSNWMDIQINKGFIPTDFIEIICTNCLKKEALSYERELIREYDPVFNVRHGETMHTAKLKNEDVIEIWNYMQNNMKISTPNNHAKIFSGRFDVAPACIVAIWKRQSWTHITRKLRQDVDWYSDKDTLYFNRTLLDDNVIEIYMKKRELHIIKYLAKQYNVSENTINGIRYSKTCKHITKELQR